MEAMEASFLSIFFEATSKIADLTESKLFCLMETSSGIWKIAGHPDLKFAFKSGNLLPRNNEVDLDNEIRQANPGKLFQEEVICVKEEPVHFSSMETSSLANKNNDRLNEKKRKKTELLQEEGPCVEKEAFSVKKIRYDNNDNIFNNTFNEVEGFADGNQTPPKEDLSSRCTLGNNNDQTVNDMENTETKIAGGKFVIISDDGKAAETEFNHVPPASMTFPLPNPGYDAAFQPGLYNPQPQQAMQQQSITQQHQSLQQQQYPQQQQPHLPSTMHELLSANMDNRIPVKDDNDDPTNAILITGFSADKTYHDFNVFFRGIGNIRRCFLKKEPPRWCVVTFESNVSGFMKGHQSHSENSPEF